MSETRLSREQLALWVGLECVIWSAGVEGLGSNALVGAGALLLQEHREVWDGPLPAPSPPVAHGNAAQEAFLAPNSAFLNQFQSFLNPWIHSGGHSPVWYSLCCSKNICLFIPRRNSRCPDESECYNLMGRHLPRLPAANPAIPLKSRPSRSWSRNSFNILACGASSLSFWAVFSTYNILLFYSTIQSILYIG